MLRPGAVPETDFSDFEVLGDQRVGIYDGPGYGCRQYAEHSHAVSDEKAWVRESIFRRFDQQISDSLKDKMDWVELCSGDGLGT